MIFNKKIIVERENSNGYYDNAGSFKRGGIEHLKMDAAIEPSQGATNEILPEARKRENVVKVFCNEMLFPSRPNGRADVLVVDERRYEVQEVKYWDFEPLRHSEAMAVEIQN